MKRASRGRALAAIVLLAALVIVFSDFVFASDPRVLLGCGDNFLYFGPNAYMMDAALRDGELPLWNPLVYCGKPFAANPQSMLFYPPNLVRSLVTPGPTPFNTHIGLALMTFAHLLFAGMGCIVLARAQGLSRVAAVTVALLFVCNGNAVGRAIVHPHFIAIVAWLPWVLWLVHKALTTTLTRPSAALSQRERYPEPSPSGRGQGEGGERESGASAQELSPGTRSACHPLQRGIKTPLLDASALSIRPLLFYALFAGLLLGVSTLGGFPQLSLYMAVAVVAFATLQAVLLSRARNGARARPFASLALVLVLVAITSLAVAAVVMLPASQLLDYTVRTKGAETAFSYETEFEHAPLELMKDLLVYAGAQDFKNLRGLGACAALLIFAALFHPNRGRTALFALLSCVLLDCAIGPPMPVAAVLAWLAPFRMALPERAMLVACLPLAMLAGFGLDAVFEPAGGRRLALVRAGALAVVGTICIAFLYRWLVVQRYWLEIAPYVLAPPAAIALFMVGGSLVRRPAPWMAMLPVLVFAEAALWSGPYLQDVLQRWPFAAAMEPLHETHAWSGANRRPAVPREGGAGWNRGMYLLRPAMNGYEPLYLDYVRQVLCSPGREGEFAREVGAWEPTLESVFGNLFLKRRFWLAREYVDGRLPGKDRLFPVTTTVFLHDAEDVPAPKVELTAVPERAVSDEAVAQDLPLPNELAKAWDATAHPDWFTVDLPVVDVPPVHSALEFDYESTAPALLYVAFRDPVSGHEEWGARQEIAPGAGARRCHIALPDMERFVPRMMVKFHEPRGALRFVAWRLWSDPADEDDLIRVESVGPNHATVRVGPLNAPRLLVYLDATYPGWHAAVDGEDAPLYFANNAFKAVAVPAGQHVVEFTFRPRIVFAGMAVSGMSVAALLAALAVLWRRRATPR